MQSAVESSLCRLWWSLRHRSRFKGRSRSSCFSSTPTSSLAFELYFTVSRDSISIRRTTKWTARLCDCYRHVYSVCHPNHLPQPGQFSFSFLSLDPYADLVSVYSWKVLSTRFWDRVSGSQIVQSSCFITHFQDACACWCCDGDLRKIFSSGQQRK